MSNRKKRQKSELLKLMRSKEKNTYETTYEDCLRWFHILNDELFSNKLPRITDIDIRWRRNCHAYYIGSYVNGTKKSQLAMNKKYKNKQFFVEVLAHELIHHYQFMNDITLSHHSESFTMWKEKFNRKGLSLRRAYDDEK